MQRPTRFLILSHFPSPRNRPAPTRSLPGTDGKILGVVHRGEVLPYAGETAKNGWLKVVYQGGDAWISGKYGRRMENVGKDG